MGIFQQFPYTNFHELNLDQIIKLVAEMEKEWTDTKTEWASYKDFIDNYFNNLDVSDEVMQALRTMADDGSLNVIMDPVIVDAVHDWLIHNITPTTPIIDATLTIPDEAADAYVTGTRLTNVESQAYINKNEISILENNVLQLRNKKVNQPLTNGAVNNGNAGQILATHGDGSTEWVDLGTPTDAQIQTAVDTWLNANPSATTTVLDDSITEEKLDPVVRERWTASMLVDRIDPYLIPYFQSNTKTTQGICAAGDYLIFTEVDGADTTYYVLDIMGKNVLSYATFQTGHSNSLTFDPNTDEILTVDDNTLYKIHMTGYVLDSMTSVDLSPASFTAISYWDGVYYLRETNTQKLYSTTDFVTYDEIMTIDYGNFASPTPQSFKVMNTLLFVPTSFTGTHTEVIFVYDLENGDLIHTYEFSSYAYGEIEDVEIYKGNLIVNFNSSAKNVYITPVFTWAPELFNNPMKHVDDRAMSTTITTIYLDNTVAQSFVDGSATEPFINLNEVLVFVTRMNMQADIIIRGVYTGSTGLYGYQGRGTFTLDNADIEILACLDSYIRLKGTGTIKRLVAQRSTVNIQGTNITLNGQNDNVVAIYGYRSVITGDLARVYQYSAQPMINGQGSIIDIFVANTDDLRTIINTTMAVIRHNSITVNGNLLRDAVAIDNNADLDDLTVPGITYRCSTDATAATLSNCPTTLLFVMNTYARSDSYIFQQLTDKNGDIYSRWWASGSTWSAWKVCRSESV